MNVENVYLAVAERMGHAGSDLLLQVLSTAMIPDEARFLLELPASNEELAAKFKTEVVVIENTIRTLAQKGLVVSSRKGFRLARVPGPLQDNTLASAPEFIPPGLSQLWKRYYEDVARSELLEEIRLLDKPMIRVIPAQKSVPPDVELLPSETVRGIIESHIGPICILNCSCRVMMGNCDRPVHTCIHFGRRAEYDLFRGAGTEITTEEALSEGSVADEAGLINTVANSSMPEAIEALCHCCGCDCLALEAPIRAGQVSRVLNPSRFLATVDQDTCIGCEECLDRCYFGAITMDSVSDSSVPAAAINPDLCMGCGLCAIACMEESITMECVRPPEYIPSDFIRVR